MIPNSQPGSRTPSRSRATASRPLLEVQVYRPSPFVALTILLIPVVATLVAAMVFLSIAGTIPPWLPFLILLWVPGLLVLWFVMQSAHTTAMSFGAGRPWRRWVEMPWEAIERVEQIGPAIRATANDGKHITVMPFLLRDGARLRREFLLRLPPQILTGTLGQEAQKLVVPDIQTTAEGELLGTVRAHPKASWRNLALLGVGVCLVVAALGFLLFGLFPGILISIGSFILALICLFTFVWLLQEVLFNENSISQTIPFIRQTITLKWDSIDLIEHSSRENLLRLRGPQRFTCAGPSLLPRAQRDLMRAYLHVYAISKGVPTVRRTWILV